MESPSPPITGCPAVALDGSRTPSCEAGTGAWRVETLDDGIVVLLFDPSDGEACRLSAAALDDLDRVLTELGHEDSLRALIVEGGKPDADTFIAGVDLDEIRAIDDPAEARRKASHGQAVLQRLATIPAVTVAAMHGGCSGAGAELALACDLRVASRSPQTRIGFPEVPLGVLPCHGGTQRLPRLIGLSAALPVFLDGEWVEATKARELGIVDRVVSPDQLREAAVELAKQALRRGGKPWRPHGSRTGLFRRMLERWPPVRALIRRREHKRIAARVGDHYSVPYRALDVVAGGFGRSLEDGLELEAKLFGELVASPVTKNLIDLVLSSGAAQRDRVQLVETVRGTRSRAAAAEALAAAEAFVREPDRASARCADSPEGLVHRVLAPYLSEAVRLLDEGYAPASIDRAVRRFGMLMGPFELLDEVGFDVVAPDGAKPDEPDVWIKRLIYSVVDRAARALEDGVVATASDVDLAMVLGAGFAPFRGGPLRFADSVGVRQIRDGLHALREPRLIPCGLVERLADSGGVFHGGESAIDSASKQDNATTVESIGS